MRPFGPSAVERVKVVMVFFVHTWEAELQQPLSPRRPTKRARGNWVYVTAHGAYWPTKRGPMGGNRNNTYSLFSLSLSFDVHWLRVIWLRNNIPLVIPNNFLIKKKFSYTEMTCHWRATEQITSKGVKTRYSDLYSNIGGALFAWCTHLKPRPSTKNMYTIKTVYFTRTLMCTMWEDRPKST